MIVSVSFVNVMKLILKLLIAEHFTNWLSWSLKQTGMGEIVPRYFKLAFLRLFKDLKMAAPISRYMKADTRFLTF